MVYSDYIKKKREREREREIEREREREREKGQNTKNRNATYIYTVRPCCVVFAVVFIVRVAREDDESCTVPTELIELLPVQVPANGDVLVWNATCSHRTD